MSELIRVERLSKAFGTVRVVDDLSFGVRGGEVCVLIGPSGCGKTTTLKMINRLVAPTSGRIFVRGEDVETADPVTLRRSIGYVIQQVGLFPHMTVEQNVTIVLRLLGRDRRRQAARARELLELVGLPPNDFLHRYPSQLSGGQQQRVGVARALAADPDIVLMDEPFGAVDPVVRKQLQRELRRIQSEVRKAIVFVTHDLAEAFFMGDRIAIMHEGRIVRHATPREILLDPADGFVATFIGEERGLRALGFRTVAEIMVPSTTPSPVAAYRLPSVFADETVLSAIRRLGLRHGPAADGDGRPEIQVVERSGRHVGSVTYRRLVEVTGEALPAGPGPL